MGLNCYAEGHVEESSIGSPKNMSCNGTRINEVPLKAEFGKKSLTFSFYSLLYEVVKPF